MHTCVRFLGDVRSRSILIPRVQTLTEACVTLSALMAQGSPHCGRGLGVLSGGEGSVLPLQLRGCNVPCEQAALLPSRSDVHILW